jgi:hypothetical protein
MPCILYSHLPQISLRLDIIADGAKPIPSVALVNPIAPATILDGILVDLDEQLHAIFYEHL